MFLVSYGSSKDRWGIGLLLKVVGSLGAFYEVDPVALHPEHPRVGEDPERWVAGLEARAGKYFLKKSMVKSRVSSASEYLAQCERVIINLRREERCKSTLQKIARLEGLLHARFARKLRWANKQLPRYFVPLGDVYIRDRGRCRVGQTYKLISPERPIGFEKTLKKIKPVPGYSGELSAWDVASLLAGLQDALEVTYCGSEEREIAPHSTPTADQVRNFFYQKPAEQGRFLLKKSSQGFLVKHEHFRKTDFPHNASELEDCLMLYVEQLDKISKIPRSARDAERIDNDIRLELEGLRIRDTSWSA